MFKQLRKGSTVNVTIDGISVVVPVDVSVAAAMLLHGVTYSRKTTISGTPRAPYCMTGVCFECLVKIDGESNCQACLVMVEEDMRIERQAGMLGTKL